MKDEVLAGTLWIEKYRPTSLDEMALLEENRILLGGYLQEEEVPHLLLSGPPGTGKTTLSRIILNTLDCSKLILNASSERGIDMIRDQVKGFVTRVAGVAGASRWNIVFLDEADAMTPEAQTALRNLIETYAEHSRFIFTCNYLYKIIGPIQSRCLQVSLGRPPLKERVRILQGILEAERIEADLPTIFSYAERFPDLRKMIMGAQKAYRSNRGVLPLAVEASEISGADVLQMITTRNWAGLRTLTTNGDFDSQQALRDLFWAIQDEHPQVGFLRHKIGQAVHEAVFTPDPIIFFLGTAAEVMEGLS